MKKSNLWLAAILLAGCATQKPKTPPDTSSLSHRVEQFERSDKINRQYGVTGNCVDINRVRSFTKKNSRMLILNLPDDKKVLVKLGSSCSAIGSFGFQLRIFGGHLCRGVEMFVDGDERVACVIEGIEPVYMLEQPATPLETAQK